MITFEEILTGQNFAAKCDYVFAQMHDTGNCGISIFAKHPPLLNGGEIVFCKTDYIKSLVDVVNKYVQKDIPFNVVTHDSDFPITEEMVQLFSDRPIHWWGINCCTQTAKSLPIGIANTYCKITMKGCDFKKEKNPTKLLYVNHRIETFTQERTWLYPYFSNKCWCTVKQPYPIGEIVKYRAELLDHKFILCPRGNGVDTHRMWEALYCGVIPVVQRHQTHEFLEGKLPILFVDNYQEVNENLLNKIYTQYLTKEWNMDILTVSWWMKRIRQESKCLQNYQK